ncbi:hypothetical protein CHF27_002380 [Romboutsia maritimum]|uniref:Flagellar protein FliT n=1 Tax=Romboutsia maritimum TaxID=2020948 RepID=A0A371IVK6_9FIRM|nr:hypothetical protein [Romboutsia maritimum]RDY24506.1 hypothetical protein CHF27_002380 [Romboutsia maritimum]
MKEKVCLYKEISLKIIKTLNDEQFEEIDYLLQQREDVLNEEIKKDELKKMLIENGLLEVDKQIKSLFDEKMTKIKDEIKEHKRLNQANSSYINFNKEKLNIFNKKV